MYLPHGGSLLRRDGLKHPSRCQRQRTRRENRHLNFYKRRDNLIGWPRSDAGGRKAAGSRDTPPTRVCTPIARLGGWRCQLIPSTAWPQKASDPRGSVGRSPRGRQCPYPPRAGPQETYLSRLRRRGGRQSAERGRRNTGRAPCTRSRPGDAPHDDLAKDSSEGHAPVPESETVGVPRCTCDLSAESQLPAPAEMAGRSSPR